METAKIIMDGEKNPQLQGFSTAGAPIEGTVCTYLVPLWGAGSDLTKDGKLNLDTPQARQPFQLYGRMKQAGVLPKNIAEIPTDRIRIDIQAGNLIFGDDLGLCVEPLENDADTKVKGKVGVAKLPHDQGGKSATCIGGWQLAVSAYSKNKQEAVKFARYLSSPEVSKMQAIMASHLPVFPSVYKDPEVLKANPWFADALPVVESAKSRPVSPQYPQVSDVDPQQHERVPRRHQDDRRRARRHEEQADAAVPVIASCPRIADPLPRAGEGSACGHASRMTDAAVTRHKDLSERALGIAAARAGGAAAAAVIVVYPIGTLFWTSLHSVDHANPQAGEPWVGLRELRCARSTTSGSGTRRWNTVLYIVVTVPGALVVGLGLALLANQPFRIKWPVRLGLLLPWALPLVFAGLIFRWFFEYNTGSSTTRWLRSASSRCNWLSNPTLAFFAICIAIIWKASSFMALMLLAGLQTIPKSLYEAAEVDGASKWQQFVEITLPMLRPAIFVALIFRTITAIQTFDIPYAMTGGGPGDCDRDARDVHPQDDARLPRLRLRLGARRADVRLSMVATVGLPALHAAQRSAAQESDELIARCRTAAPMVWLAAIIVVVNGFFPAVWILLTSLKTETELMRVPITYLPGGADARTTTCSRSPRSRSCASC